MTRHKSVLESEMQSMSSLKSLHDNVVFNSLVQSLSISSSTREPFLICSCKFKICRPCNVLTAYPGLKWPPFISTTIWSLVFCEILEPHLPFAKDMTSYVMEMGCIVLLSIQLVNYRILTSALVILCSLLLTLAHAWEGYCSVCVCLSVCLSTCFLASRVCCGYRTWRYGQAPWALCTARNWSNVGNRKAFSSSCIAIPRGVH